MQASIHIVVAGLALLLALFISTRAVAEPNDGGGCPDCGSKYAFDGDIYWWYGFLGGGSGAGGGFGGADSGDAACLGCKGGLCQLVRSGSNFCSEDGDTQPGVTYHRCDSSGGACYAR